MSMVPLNFGAAAAPPPPFSAKPHFVQVAAVSGFCVPQFGQNKGRTSDTEIVRTYTLIALQQRRVIGGVPRGSLRARFARETSIDIQKRIAVACARQSPVFPGFAP